MKKIGSETMYVAFKFGSVARVSVDLYEGKSIEECVRMRSSEIDSYLRECDKQFIKLV